MFNSVIFPTCNGYTSLFFYRAAKCVFCHRAPEVAGVHGATVVCKVHQQVKACGGWKDLIPAWTELVGAALHVLGRLKPTPGAETGKKTDWGIVNQTHVFNSARSNDWSKTPGSWGLDCLMNLLCVLAWTHQRFLMTFETEESRSSLEMKLYVMPKKASGLSWAFSFSWLTVYTSVMESTAETKTAPQIHVCILFFVSVENRLRVTLSSDLLMCYCGDILSLFIVNKPHGNDDIWFIYLC